MADKPYLNEETWKYFWASGMYAQGITLRLRAGTADAGQAIRTQVGDRRAGVECGCTGRPL